MATFKKLKAVKSVLNEFPGIKTYKELDILIEIGYHQEIGAPLTIKQLMLLEIASPATVRRVLQRMIATGVVEKSVSEADHRAVALMLHNRTAEKMVHRLGEIVLRLEHILMDAGPAPRKGQARKK